MDEALTLPPGAPAFLQACGWSECLAEEFSADAAFRRYYRLSRPGETRVLMHAPDPSERSEWFVALARHINRFGLSAPEIYAERLEEGLILLEDLGTRQYYALDPGGSEERELYAAAVDVLALLHAKPMLRQLGSVEIPRYTHERMRLEAGYMLDWHWPELMGGKVTDDVRAAFDEAWRAVLPAGDYADDRLVQFDYHSPNLMWLPERKGAARVGILDFQDAMRGPASYDLVSLLQDARRELGEGLEDDMIARYLAAMPEFQEEPFRTSYAVMGAQRAARILGVFVRLWRRDGKPRYLRHLPRVWRRLDTNLAHPALRPLRDWFDEYMPARCRRDLALEAV